MTAAKLEFELLDGPHTPDENRDEYGRAITVKWVWRVRRVDAFGEWVRDLEVQTNVSGVVEEIRDDTDKIWPDRAGFDSLGPDRALHDALRDAVDHALARTEFDVLTRGDE